MTDIPAPRKKRKVNYINNKTLYGSMIHYKTELREAREKRLNREPQVPKYKIGRAHV